MTKAEKDALDGLALLAVQRVPCADSESELVAQEFIDHEDGSVTVNATCPKCGAVATATVTKAAMAEHVARYAGKTIVQDLLKKETKHWLDRMNSRIYFTP